MSNTPVRVAAAVILRGDRVLLARRPEGAHLANLWEFPGGKVEPGEGLEACLEREIREELETTVLVRERWRVVNHRYPDKWVEIHFFFCRLTGPEPRPVGASELAWASGPELAGFAFPEADRAVVRELAELLSAPPGAPRIALVTGANRGLGLEVSRQLAAGGYLVLLTARDASKARAAALTLAGSGRVESLELDVRDARSVSGAASEVEKRYGLLDVLVNNAAIHYDDWESAGNAAIDGTVMEAIETNLLGPWRVCQAFLPLLRKSTGARIVNVSSEAGSLAEMGAGPPAYQVTKAALNALTRTLAAELRDAHILVNAVCPGWVATDMGEGGGRPVPEGARGIVWAATLPDGGPTGGFFRDGNPVPW